VKPLHEDGSIGITAQSVVLSKRAFHEQVRYIHTEHNQDALVEEFINGRDVSISVVGSTNDLSVLPPSECIYLNSTSHPILTYDSKWIVDSHDFQNTQVICPTRLEKNLKNDLGQTSINAFRIMECKDYARMDFRIRNGVAYLLEVNPNPSIHPQEAGYSRSWKSTGKTYDQLILKILMSSYENHQIQTD
jgi:D-alanine-D-alanine ligase